MTSVVIDISLACQKQRYL